MVAPEVEQVIFTDWALVYVPAAGLNVGVATGSMIVYVPLATPLSVIPDLNALALSVVVVLMEIAELYTDDELVGLLPLVVYRMVAPEVEQVIFADWALVYVPAAGLKAGVATVAARA